MIGELGDRTTVTTAESDLRIHAIVSLACDFVPRSVSNDAIGSVRHLTIYISGCQLVIRQVDRAITRMIASCANPLSLRSREDTIRGPQKTRFPDRFWRGDRKRRNASKRGGRPSGANRPTPRPDSCAPICGGALGPCFGAWGALF